MQKIIKKPLISILMNCYNGEKFLIEALNNVINQSYKNWELLFWDNQSTDKSLEIVKRYRDKRIKIFYSTQHTNLGKARKNAFEKANGKYLAFLDVDDTWEVDKLKKQVKAFENDEELGLSFTNSLYFSKKNKEYLYKPNPEFILNTKSLITDYYISLNSVMININKIEKLEYDFDPNYNHICDFDLIVRLSSIAKFKYLNKVLSGWRIHGNNESFKRREIFNIEKEKWCNFHLKNEYLSLYKNEINELKITILAEKRILKNKFCIFSFKKSDLLSVSGFKKKLFIIFSFIPFFPKIIYQIKNYLFRFKWY